MRQLNYHWTKRDFWSEFLAERQSKRCFSSLSPELKNRLTPGAPASRIARPAIFLERIRSTTTPLASRAPVCPTNPLPTAAAIPVSGSSPSPSMWVCDAIRCDFVVDWTSLICRLLFYYSTKTFIFFDSRTKKFFLSPQTNKIMSEIGISIAPKRWYVLT